MCSSDLYPDSKNSWLPAKELTHAKELLAKFKSRHTSKEGIRVLQAQEKPKEGILLRVQLAPSRVPAKSRTSPSKPALKPSYSHVVKQGLKTPTCDPGKTHMMKSRASPVFSVASFTICFTLILLSLILTIRLRLRLSPPLQIALVATLEY